MISILKLGRTTFVLSNKELAATPGVFEATVLHRQDDPIPEVAVPLAKPRKKIDNTEQTERHYTPRPTGKRRHLDEALERIKRFSPNSEIQKLCIGYEKQVRLNSPVGQTCHSSAWRYLTESGTKGRPANGQIYSLIAWVITHCSLDVSDTYPLTYVVREQK